jgi:hypothetical protein
MAYEGLTLVGAIVTPQSCDSRGPETGSDLVDVIVARVRLRPAGGAGAGAGANERLFLLSWRSLTLRGGVAISRRMIAIGTQDRLRGRTSAPAPVRDRC